MVELRNAFGCLTLRTGNLIMGWLNVIFGIIATAILAIASYILSNNKRESNADDSGFGQETMVLTYVNVMIAVSITCTITGACQVYGAHQGRKGFLVPYLVLAAICITLNIVSSIISLALVAVPLRVVFAQLAPTIVAVYFYLIVWSFYKELRDGKGSQPLKPIA